MNGTTTILRKRTRRKHISPQKRNVSKVLCLSRRGGRDVGRWDGDVFWRRKSEKKKKKAVPEYGD